MPRGTVAVKFHRDRFSQILAGPRTRGGEQPRLQFIPVAVEPVPGTDGAALVGGQTDVGTRDGLDGDGGSSLVWVVAVGVMTTQYHGVAGGYEKRAGKECTGVGWELHDVLLCFGMSDDGFCEDACQERR